MQKGGRFRIGPPQEVSFLPYDFVPTALGALRDEWPGDGRVILSMEREYGDAGTGSPYHVVGADDIRGWLGLSGASRPTPSPRDEERAADATAEIAGRQAAGDLLFFGPPSAARGTGRHLRFGSPAIRAAPHHRRAVAVIDLGIAFWNRRFRSPDGDPMFAAMQYLDFDGGSGAEYPDGVLQPSDISTLCGIADAPDGQTRISRHLAARFPGSYFGSRPDQEAFWHGTAIADIAAGTAGDALMFGIELPFASLRDWKGDALGAILPLALRAAVNLAASVPRLPLTIALPFAFTGGPHDGTHPVAAAMARFLANVRRTRDVTLVVPAGNHLQDQCCAELGPATKSVPSPSIAWHLPPDDFSPNCVEICLTSGTPAEIAITTPDGQTEAIRPGEGTIAQLELRGGLIGAVHRPHDHDGCTKIRLALARTGWAEAGAVPAPYGNWTIGVRADRPARLWVLRDDRDTVYDRSRPHRRSYLVDPQYRERGPYGAYVMTDPAAGPMRRSGTASVLSTAPGGRVVQADQRLGPGPAAPSWYSGSPVTGGGFADSFMVDDGREGRGIDALGNGSARRFRFSGTSAACALAARYGQT